MTKTQTRPTITARLTCCEPSIRAGRPGWVIDWPPADDREEQIISRALLDLRAVDPQGILHKNHGTWWVSDQALPALVTKWPALATAVERVMATVLDQTTAREVQA